MPIFDLEPYAAFSGSMMDHIMSGALIQSYTFIGGNLVINTGSRNEIGSHVSGIIKGAGTTEYGAYVNAVSGGYKITRNNFRAIPAFETTKRYYDTMVPSIDDIMKTDTRGALFTNVQNPSGWNPLSFVYFIGVSASNLLCELTESSTTPQGTGERLSNNVWPFSYPFERRYNSARRTTEPLKNVNQIKYTASAAFRNSAPWYVAGYNTPTQGTSSADEIPTVNLSDGFWGGVSNSNTISKSRFTVGYIVPSNDAAIASSLTNKKAIVLYTTGGVVNSAGTFTPTVTGTYGTPNPSNLLQPEQPTSEDVVRHFYGFGDGPNNTVEFATVFSSSWVATTIPFRLGYGSKIRGWKYGLMNGNEVNPKCIFVRNHFGFLRDMLEQRLITRTYDKTTNTLFNPLEITFISGSDLPPGVDAYATASFKPSENIYDSGIYDMYYASGQPWKDR